MDKFAIHHSAVQSTTSQLNGVNNYHRGKWNMKSTLGWYVGYNYFIDVSGKVTNTRAVGEETMAQVGHNFNTISICLAGDFNKHLPNKRQIESLQKIIRNHPEIPESLVLLHRDVQSNRTCPGMLFTHEYLDVVVLQLPVEADDEDKEKKEKLEAELKKSVALLTKLVEQLKKLLWNQKNSQ